MAKGYNHELLKSETQMRSEIEQALGEELPQLRIPSPSTPQKHNESAVRPG